MLSALRISRRAEGRAAPRLERVAPTDERHAVQDLQGAQVRGDGLPAPQAQASSPELDHAHARGVGAEVDVGDPHRFRKILAVTDGQAIQRERAVAEAQLVEPARTEGVRVVEGDALGPDAAVAGDAAVAARQGRRQDAMALLEAVAQEEPVRSAQGVVDLRVELVVLPLEARVDDVVVDDLSVHAMAVRVRRRDELLQDVPGGGIPTLVGDDVPGEGAARQRVVDHLADGGEVAVAHRRRGHGGDAILSLCDPRALVVREEEGPVLPEGAAQGSSELMLAERGPGDPGPVVEEVVGVERVVTQETERAAVELVGARPDLQVDDAAQRLSELGGVGARLQLELVEGVDAREHHHRLEPALVVVDAVEQERVVARALPVRGERCGIAPAQAARPVDVGSDDASCDTRNRARQADEVPPVEGQVLDLGRPHRRAQIRRRRLDERVFGLHRDRVGPVADVEGQIGAHLLVHRDQDSGQRCLPKARRLRDERVGPGGEQRCREHPGGIGGDVACEAGRVVGQSHARARNHGTACVLDGSEDRAADGLRTRGSGCEGGQKTQAQEPPGRCARGPVTCH